MKKSKSFIAEFKNFISRGNVIDMAVGVVVGGAFTAIVNSLVKDIITPLIGVLIGGIDLTQYKIVLAPAVGEKAESAVLYGSFISQIITFLIIAFVVFLAVKAINIFRKKEEAAPPPPPEPSEEVLLLREIRDSLKK